MEPHLGTFNFKLREYNLCKTFIFGRLVAEVRLAFMNYYLYSNAEKRQQIDDYLYEREVAPINRQMNDPRIYKGEGKKL
ncbi:MAG: hypothetical protein ABJB11_13745 [Ferruginibacter sp.]